MKYMEIFFMLRGERMVWKTNSGKLSTAVITLFNTAVITVIYALKAKTSPKRW